MTGSQKIFVEPDEEIVFTVEKINNSEKNRVIVVVPQNAALVSSAVSLKLLSMQMMKRDKLIIMVTESETGLNLAEKANLVAKKKISEVNADAWQYSKELKERLIFEKEKIKSELLGSRREDIKPGEAVVTGELVKGVVEEDVVEEKDEVLVKQKPRLSPKVVSVNGITLFAGGDITEREDLLVGSDPETVSDLSNNKKVRTLEDSVAELDSEEENDESAEEGFVGKDLTNTDAPEERVHSRLNQRQKEAKTSQMDVLVPKLKKLAGKLTEGNTMSKSLKIFSVTLVLFFLFSYIVLPSVTINLVFKESEVRVNETITAKASVSEVNVEKLEIPAIPISKESSTSGSANATGEGQEGENAQGLVDIDNNTGEDIELPANTTLTDIQTGLVYRIIGNTSIKKEQRVTDIPVKADKLGENYNIEDRTATFEVAGFTTDDVIAYAFLDISGGTSEDVVVVSQGDIDALKADLEEDLKAELLSLLEDLISEEDILLSGSETFKEVEFKSSVSKNKKADSFTIDLKMSVSAMKVQKTDLVTISEELIKKNQETSAEATIQIINPEVKNVSVTNNKATFQLTSQAGVLKDLSDEAIKEAIKGKGVNEAKDYFRDQDDIDDFTFKYRPSYIPFFLQKVPNNLEKIEILKNTELVE